MKAFSYAVAFGEAPHTYDFLLPVIEGFSDRDQVFKPRVFKLCNGGNKLLNQYGIAACFEIYGAKAYGAFA